MGSMFGHGVVDDPAQEDDHAIIPLHSTVEQTARPRDRVMKVRLALEILAHVNIREKKTNHHFVMY